MGVLHGGLAYSAVRLLLGVPIVSSEQQTELWTASVLVQPFGAWLVGFAGVSVGLVGLYQFYNAYQGLFLQELQLAAMSQRAQQWAAGPSCARRCAPPDRRLFAPGGGTTRSDGGRRVAGCPANAGPAPPLGCSVWWRWGSLPTVSLRCSWHATPAASLEPVLGLRESRQPLSGQEREAVLPQTRSDQSCVDGQERAGLHSRRRASEPMSSL
jgi:hypothetical protein